MWPRVAEIGLALWLVASPWTLPGVDGPAVWLPNLTAGVLVIGLAAASLARRWRRAHAAVVPVAVLLGLWGWAAFPRPGPPAAQNQILVGLLLALVAIVPTRPSRPPG